MAEQDQTSPPPVAAKGAPSRVGMAASVATLAVTALLVDLAVETVVSGSPVRWWVLGVAGLSAALLALAWRPVGPTTRLAIPLAALSGLIAWATIRLGGGAEPGLRMATLALPRIVLSLGLVGLASALALLFGLGSIRRAWYVGALFAAFAVYAAVPAARGLVSGAVPEQVLGGGLDWQGVPAWFQGGYLSTGVLLPIGLIAGVMAIVSAFVASRKATWLVAGLLVVTAALLAQSAEMTRAGRSHLTSALTAPILGEIATVPLQPAVLPPGADAPLAADGSVSAPQGQGETQAAPATVTPAPAGAVAVAQQGQPVANKAIELRVTGYRTAPSTGGEIAGPGREFVFVDTAWKNILPKQKVNRKKATDRTAGMGGLGFGGGATAQDRAQDEANTTIESVPFEVSPLSKHLWLVADGRFAEAIDVEGTRALDGHLGPESIGIASFQQVVSGGIAFKAPAGAQALSLLFLDAVNGHLLVPLKGAPPILASSLGGGSRANEFVDLAMVGSSWSGPTASDPGSRTFVLGIRGISRQNAIVDVPFGEFGFLQTDQGCLVQPDASVPGLSRQLAPVGRFLPFVPTEGQLAFAVPAGSNPIAFLLRLQQGGPIDVPFKPGAKPAWPAPEATITDGDVLRVLKLPGTTVPVGLPPGRPGTERLALDLVVENLRAGSGIELQAQQQFRLVTPDGRRHEPSADSAKAPCRLTGAAVVPAAGQRRFTLVYDVPPGQPLQLEYRGFAVQSELVKVR